MKDARGTAASCSGVLLKILAFVRHRGLARWPVCRDRECASLGSQILHRRPSDSESTEYLRYSSPRATPEISPVFHACLPSSPHTAFVKPDVQAILDLPSACATSSGHLFPVKSLTQSATAFAPYLYSGFCVFQDEELRVCQSEVVRGEHSTALARHAHPVCFLDRAKLSVFLGGIAADNGRAHSRQKRLRRFNIGN